MARSMYVRSSLTLFSILFYMGMSRSYLTYSGISLMTSRAHKAGVRNVHLERISKYMYLIFAPILCIYFRARSLNTELKF